MRIRTLLSIILLLPVMLLAAQPQSVQYSFPLHESEFLPRSTEIIVRPGPKIDASSVSSDLFQVRGERSGDHSGRVVLSTDGHTLIFKPDRLFDASERVHVIFQDGLQLQTGAAVSPFEFSFKVTPLEQPIDPYQYRKELGLPASPSDFDVPSLQKTMADTLPRDFPTFTVEINGEPSPGDIFFSPTRFISNDGYNMRLSNSGELKYYGKIESGVPFDFKVLPNGMMSYGVMYEPGAQGAYGLTDYFMMDSSYSVIDEYQMGNGYIADYHEFLYRPNGHVLMNSYDVQPVKMNALVKGGHPGALVVGGVIQELDQNKNVIFQWRSWDHYKITDSYNDLTQTVIDAVHLNSIEMDHDNHLIISALALAEITKINRKTGDIMWRMGGKNNEFTFVNESQEHAPIYFMYQHDVRRLPNGNITMFDNGDRELRLYSRVVEYAVDEDQKTVTNVWEYRKSPDIYSDNMGNAQRLPNGNTLIGWGFATMHGGVPAITEVDREGNVVFELTFDKPLVASYRAFKFEYNGGSPFADVVVPEVQIGNTYEFVSGNQQTGLSIKINDKDGFGYNEAIATAYNYAPLAPEFVAKAPLLQQSRVVLSQFNIQNVNADLSFDVDFYDIEHPDSVLVYFREFEGRGLFLPLPTVYNDATNKIVTTMTKFGEFALAYPDHESQTFAPLQIEPYNGETVDQTRPVEFEWSPVGYTTEYTFQVASDENFNNLVVEERFITTAIYELGTIEPNTTYFWRVKSYNDIGESEWSPAFEFQTAEPYIELQIPDANSKWRRGLEYYITWTDIIDEDVVLELFKSDEFLSVIDTVTNTGAYKWSIPIHLDAASDYKIKIYSVEHPEVSDMSDSPFLISDTDTQVETDDRAPTTFTLSQNHPNPFNPTTQIHYQIPTTAHVTLKVFDIRGSLIRTLVDDVQSANHYSIDFNGSDLPTGVYLYTLNVGNQFFDTKKMLFVK